MAEGQPKSPSDSQRKQGAGGDNKSPPSVVSVSTLQGEILEQELVRVGVPHDKAEKATRVVAQFVAQHHSGPLPPAELFEQYERICPGAAREILDMAVRAQKHGHEMDKAAMESEVTYREIGIVAATLILLTMIGGAITCALFGREIVGAALGGATALIGVAGVFIRGRGLFEKAPSKPSEPQQPKPKTRDSRGRRK